MTPDVRQEKMKMKLVLLCVLTCMACACSRHRHDRGQANLASMKALASAVAAYHSKTGVYPATLEELVAKQEGQMVGPRTVPVDPWGTVYEMQTVSGTPRVVSAGPDGKAGTEDDTYWIVEPANPAYRR